MGTKTATGIAKKPRTKTTKSGTAKRKTSGKSRSSISPKKSRVIRAATGYVLRTKVRRTAIKPHHKEWRTHGPGEASIVETYRRRAKPSWFKPWQWGFSLANRKTTHSRKKKEVKNIVAEALYNNRRKRARDELALMNMHRAMGREVNATREWKLKKNSKSPYSARLNVE
jgi:hypothetical protein